MGCPYDVIEYSIDVVCVHISNRTDTPEHHVRQKKQIQYLHNYLGPKGQNADTVIVENEYVERSFLEDYSSYYSRCFHKYRKTCSRLHFFSGLQVFGNADLEAALCGEDNRRRDEIASRYLGFIVVRPIPYAFLGKVCLKPFSYLGGGGESLISRHYSASLFGIPLGVKSVAFQEQDDAVSACATTALWAFLHATKEQNQASIPSPNQITQMAKPKSHGHDRQFPNHELSPIMICRCLQENNLEPEMINLESELQKSGVPWRDALKHYAHAYTSSHIPLICGVSVFRKRCDAGHKYEYVGEHAITILGCAMDAVSKVNNESGPKFAADAVSKIYVHDDRYGPYARIDFVESKRAGKGRRRSVEIIYPGDEKTHPVKEYLLVTLNANADAGPEEIADGSGSVSNEVFFADEVLIPSTLFIGVYHKIRISYQSVHNTCKLFTQVINMAAAGVPQGISSYALTLLKSKYSSSNLIDKVIDDFEEGLKKKADMLSRVRRGFMWSISVIEGKELKQDLLLRSTQDKYRILTKSLPKHIWRAQATSQGNPAFDLLFDATDIQQGNVFMDAIVYDSVLKDFFEHLEYYCSEIYKRPQGDFGGDDKHHLWGIFSHFKARRDGSYSESLDRHYGFARVPRYIKRGEKQQDVILENSTSITLYETAASVLDKTCKYIWLINEEGGLVYGVENAKVGHGDTPGHPTLNSARPSRIAGELFVENGGWVINAKSGRYSGHYSEDEKQTYLENALKKRFNVFFPNEDIKLSDFPLGRSAP